MSERPLEWCREWLPGTADNCHQPAVVIIWGKLFPPSALGPRCEEHAAKRIGQDFYSDRLNQWAVFDLRGLTRQSTDVTTADLLSNATTRDHYPESAP